MGLSCGGTIEVLVEPAVRPELLDAARRSSGSVVATVIGGTASVGSGLVVLEDGTQTTVREVPEALRAPMVELATSALRRLASGTETIETADGPVEVFFEVYPRRPTLLVFGGVHIAMALIKIAGSLGYRTVVADGREGFLTRERFPGADELILGWPEEVFRKVGLDHATCVCLLTHDPKFDEPALEAALRSPACYVGAIGSRKTQAHRRERLRALGFSDAEVARLHGPIGLDLGGRAPEEIALAIMAEITAVRYGREPTVR
jgi:xanthine dehydrogenase accessory factor